MPKVSVIIPVYNVEEYLRECLDSIVNQTLKDIEIICVDDGSTDDSRRILEEYLQKDSRFKLLQGKKLGGGAARNSGIENATGEYVMFLDSDDFFDFTMLEEMSELGDRTNSDIVVCDFNCYNTVSKEYKSAYSQVFPDNFFDKETFIYKNCTDKLFDYFLNSAWNKLYRLEYIRNYNLKFQEIKRTNDLYFSRLSIVFASRITGIDKTFVHYRIGQKTNCQSNNHKCPLEFLKSLVALKRTLCEKGYYEELRDTYTKLAVDVINYNIYSVREYPYTVLKLYFSLYSKYLKMLFLPSKSIDKKILKKSILGQIFSLRNQYEKDQKYKVLRILGFKLTFKS